MHSIDFHRSLLDNKVPVCSCLVEIFYCDIRSSILRHWRHFLGRDDPPEVNGSDQNYRKVPSKRDVRWIGKVTASV